MSLSINKEGKVIITLESIEDKNPGLELLLRRQAIYDLICQRESDFNDKDTIYWAVELLKDMDLTEEQLDKVLTVPQ